MIGCHDTKNEKKSDRRPYSKSSVGNTFGVDGMYIQRLLAIAFSILAFQTSLATPEVDQEHIPVNTSGGFQIADTQGVGQVFTVGLEGLLTEVVATQVKRNSCDEVTENLNIELYEMAGGVPSGTAIASRSFQPEAIPSRFDTTGAPISLPVPDFPVAVGDVLIIKVTSEAPENGCNYAWLGESVAPSATYIGGDPLLFFNDGRQPLSIASIDMAFKTFVDAGRFPFDGDLVSYWSFDDGTATDQAGTNDGTLVGGVVTTGGGNDIAPIANNSDALRFDGVVSEMRVPNDPSLNFAATDSFTLSMWFKRESDRPIYHLMGKRDGCSLSINYQLARDFGLLHFNWTRVDANVDAVLGQWTHIASTYDGSATATARIYINGALSGTVSPHALGPVVNADLIVGSSGACPDDQRFQGVIDEVRIYDRALDNQEIATLAGLGENEAPTADAGPDQNARAGTVVFFDGTSSFDDNTQTQDLIANWTIASAPIGSATDLVGSDTLMPSLLIDISGTYVIELVVTDEAGLSSSADSVIISDNNLAPTANAGPDQLTYLGTTVFLNGSASFDPEGDLVTHDWLVTTPSNSTLNFDGVSPSFTALELGVYIVELTVSDFLGANPISDVAEITVATTEDFARTTIMETEDLTSALDENDVTTAGNQNALTNFFAQAVRSIQKGNIADGINKLENALLRTDGCVERGSPDDGSGTDERDWIVSCSEQATAYNQINLAIEALISN